ncbi:putative hydrolase alpha/beta fold protein [Capsulimonas corticalis]|uniref:Hydrolase alpha/beta fold protein n=1 Tax=Capsulimonas corticalis TaxID=2219043 RepID=A0A402CPY7_9BACT|nr:alpha/beta hydrolase [Capsulimonas corticalis]BDI32910.1 putative hydrolase alpha/beta fold protein [Capsulimonas corticalis]
MWLPLFALFFLPAPVIAFFAGIVKLIQALQRKRMGADGVLGLTLVVLSLTGRWWMRYLRPAIADEPKAIPAARRGVALGMGGVALSWEERGPADAPAILLCHGWSLTQEIWYYQKEALSKKHRVISWDMRANGRSSAPANGDYSLDALLFDLAVVFDASDAGRHPKGCILVGHSLGAMLAPLFAQRFPDRMRHVRGFAMLAGTDRPLLETMKGRWWLAPTRRILWEPLGKLLARWPAFFDLCARGLLQTGCLHMALMYGLHCGRESRGQNDFVAERCGRFSMRAAGLGAITCFDFDARAALPLIDVPVLLMTGEADVNMPPDIQREMAASIRDAELIIHRNCGHLNLLECYDEVNKHLERFAARCFGES